MNKREQQLDILKGIGIMLEVLKISITQ